MKILTAEEKVRERAEIKRARCERISRRIKKLIDAGYKLYDAKCKAANEEKITVVHLYGLLNWYKKNN